MEQENYPEGGKPDTHNMTKKEKKINRNEPATKTKRKTSYVLAYKRTLE